MIGRYLRAFFVALKLTLRGETPSSSPDQPLRDWMAQAVQRLDQVETLAARHRIDPAQVTLRIDMRDIRMATILRITRYHMREEYPLLLRQPAAQTLTVLHATNMDDHHRLIRLAGAPELAGTPVSQAVAALAAHLEAIPTVP